MLQVPSSGSRSRSNSSAASSAANSFTGSSALRPSALSPSPSPGKITTSSPLYDYYMLDLNTPNNIFFSILVGKIARAIESHGASLTMILAAEIGALPSNTLIRLNQNLEMSRCFFKYLLTASLFCMPAHSKHSELSAEIRDLKEYFNTSTSNDPHQIYMLFDQLCMTIYQTLHAICTFVDNRLTSKPAAHSAALTTDAPTDPIYLFKTIVEQLTSQQPLDTSYGTNFLTTPGEQISQTTHTPKTPFKRKRMNEVVLPPSSIFEGCLTHTQYPLHRLINNLIILIQFTARSHSSKDQLLNTLQETIRLHIYKVAKFPAQLNALKELLNSTLTLQFHIEALINIYTLTELETDNVHLRKMYEAMGLIPHPAQVDALRRFCDVTRLDRTSAARQLGEHGVLLGTLLRTIRDELTIPEPERDTLTSEERGSFEFLISLLATWQPQESRQEGEIALSFHTEADQSRIETSRIDATTSPTEDPQSFVIQTEENVENDTENLPLTFFNSGTRVSGMLADLATAGGIYTFAHYLLQAGAPLSLAMSLIGQILPRLGREQTLDVVNHYRWHTPTGFFGRVKNGLASLSRSVGRELLTSTPILIGAYATHEFAFSGMQITWWMEALTAAGFNLAETFLALALSLTRIGTPWKTEIHPIQKEDVNDAVDEDDDNCESPAKYTADLRSDPRSTLLKKEEIGGKRRPNYYGATP